MRRSPLLVSGLAALVLLAAFALAGQRPTGAQDATPSGAVLAGHPLVGAWMLDTDADDPANPAALAVFSSDGVYTQADYDGSDGVGSWESTGPTTVAMTFLQQFPDEQGDFGGRTIVRATIKVAPDGQSLTAEYTVEFLGGDEAAMGQIGPGTATGTRIAVEPMGTPTTSIADAFGGGGPAAGTPAP